MTGKLRLTTDKLIKNLGTKQEGDRSADTMRSALRCIYSIFKLPDTETNAKFNEYYIELMKNEKIRNIFNTISSHN